MKNLLEKEVFEEVTARVHKLHPESAPAWGTMTVAQMMAHVREACSVPLSDKPMPRMLIGRLIGWTFKSKLYNDTPRKKNRPTAPPFLIKDQRDYVKEKLALQNTIKSFHTAGPEGIGKFPHPVFGKFTKEQWGKIIYKHADHHLTQFGV